MHRSPIATLASAAPTEAIVAGFVDAIRVLKRMIFVIVSDRSGRLQVTIERAAADQPASELEQPR